MSGIKNFSKEIERLLRNLKKIPDEFFVRTDGGKYRTIWFMDRQKPSVETNYSFDEERFGVTKDGQIIWGFDSGCSCPSPWSSQDYGDDSYFVKTWKEFEIISDKEEFDKGWEEECYSNLKDYLLLIDNNEDIKGDDVLKIRNSEIRRYLIKKVGYENLKNLIKASVLHTDGTSELLDIEINGEKERYVKVKDTSTSREYLLYVGFGDTCKQAIAWTFGLSEKDYNPLIET